MFSSFTASVINAGFAITKLIFLIVISILVDISTEALFKSKESKANHLEAIASYLSLIGRYTFYRFREFETGYLLAIFGYVILATFMAVKYRNIRW